MKKAIGIDIGGTKIAAGLVFEDGQVTNEVRIPSNINSREGMYERLCQAIDELLDKSELHEEKISFGIGVPGLVDRKNGIAVFQNNLPWENFPIVARLQERYSNCEHIALDNDVYQAAYAEWGTSGLAADDLLVFLTVSTGISAAIINGGTFLRGKGFAGELGLLPVRNGQQSLGRLEKLASGPALAEAAREAYNDGTLTTEEVFQRYHRKDPKAVELIQQWSDSLTHGIYALICILDPQKIVFGGSVLQQNPDMLDLLKVKLAKELIEAQKTSLEGLEMTKFENNAGVIGAGLRAIAEMNKD
ncbi:ROK family protein [Enterococcus sp. LJL51]|uniref:ROK family protein n=1 Tax=Enterococcus sp. LJL51 TaxID=3416656 RepID=UPI003CEFAEF1